MALTSEERERIIVVYKRSHHVVNLAQRILEQDGLTTSVTSIINTWKEKEYDPTPMKEFVKSRIKDYSRKYNRYAEKVRLALVEELSQIIPDYGMTIDNVRMQMKNLGIEPQREKKWIGGGKKCSYSAGSVAKKSGVKPRRDYEFCADA